LRIEEPLVDTLLRKRVATQPGMTTGLAGVVERLSSIDVDSPSSTEGVASERGD